MYRCKDCGKEYKEKIDYCDCGNNTFDYIEDVVQVKTPVKKQPLSPEHKAEIISKIFFIVCLILSLIVWIMPIKAEQTIKEEVKEQKTDFKTIPNIEKIWNSTPPKVQTAERKEEKSSNPLDEIRQAIPDKKPVQTTQKPVQNVSQTNSKTQNKSVNKPTSKPAQSKPVTTQPKPVTTQPKQTASQPKPVTTQPKPVTQNKQTSNPNNLTKKPTQNTQNIQNVQPKPVEKYNPNSPEMLKYKGSLRSALFAKLPIGSVQGSGSCSVQFAVDSSGKLINRAFTKQSDNKSLNDAVYYMLMSVPRFASPPEEYHQELIRMNINMNADGSYEISIY